VCEGSSVDRGASLRGIVPASARRADPEALTPRDSGVGGLRDPGVGGLRKGEDARGATACGEMGGAAGRLEARSEPSSATPSASARLATADDAVAKRAWGEAAVTFANQASNAAGSGTPCRVALAVAASEGPCTAVAANA
jgi:hypothetical protein